MKLKKFEEFVNEAKARYSDVEIETEENVFLVDGVVYYVGTITVGGTVESEKADREVGIMSDYSYVEDWWPESMETLEKFANPEDNAELIKDLDAIETDSASLASMNLGAPTNAQKQKQRDSLIWDAAFDKELVEVGPGEEFDRVFKSIVDGKAVDLTRTFDDRVNNAFTDEMEDYGSDYEPDYDDWE